MFIRHLSLHLLGFQPGDSTFWHFIQVVSSPKTSCNYSCTKQDLFQSFCRGQVLFLPLWHSEEKKCRDGIMLRFIFTKNWSQFHKIMNIPKRWELFRDEKTFGSSPNGAAPIYQLLYLQTLTFQHSLFALF